MCQLHLRCHWPPRLLSHTYNAPALRGDFIVTYLPSQPKEVPNLSSVTLPLTWLFEHVMKLLMAVEVVGRGPCWLDPFHHLVSPFRHLQWRDVTVQRGLTGCHFVQYYWPSVDVDENHCRHSTVETKLDDVWKRGARTACCTRMLSFLLHF